MTPSASSVAQTATNISKLIARRSLPGEVLNITDALATLPAEHVVHIIRACAMHGGLRMAEPSDDILSACDALEEAWREEDARLHGADVGHHVGWGMAQ